MKFESFDQSKNVSPVESEEKEIDLAKLEEVGFKKDFEDRSSKLARLALATLTFYGVVDVAEMLVLRDAGAAAYAAESQTLAESISTGKVRLSSGEEIIIPKPGEFFERVIVYTPEGKDPDRLIMLFSQTHQLSKRQMEGDSMAERIESLAEANDSQERIYKGLKQLIDQGSLHSVCSEGNSIWDGTKSDLVAFSENNPTTTAEILVNYFPGSDLEQVVKEANEAYKQYFNQTKDINGAISKFNIVIKNNPIAYKYIEKYKYIGGASRLLAAEGELIPCPGEDAVAYNNLWSNQEVQLLWDKPSSTWTTYDRALFKKVVYEDRENGAIETIMNAVPDDVVGLTFGAGHDFTNNVDEWNARNPDQQIGLVDMRAPYH